MIMTMHAGHVAKRRAAALTAGALLCLGLVASAAATEHLQDKLPVAPENSRYSCTNCHTYLDAYSNSELNAFGEDFREYGLVWNADLAAMDSDGDSCTNGVEIGDSDGDGQLDGHVQQESSNPGVADCGGAFSDEKTWGALKSLFEGRR